LRAASSGIDAVLGLEVMRQVIYIDRLNIAPDGIFHLHPITRVLERNPLDAIVVLSHNKRSGRRNRSGGSIRIHRAASTAIRSLSVICGTGGIGRGSSRRRAMDSVVLSNLLRAGGWV